MLYTSLILILIVSFFLILNHWHQNKGVIYLVVCIIGLSKQNFSTLLLITKPNFTLLAVLLHFDFLVFLIGPCFIYYLKSVIKGNFVWDKYFLVFSIPSILLIINLIPFYSVPFQSKVDSLKQILHNLPGLNTLFLPIKYHFLFLFIYTVSCVVYGIINSLRMISGTGIYIKKKVTVLINRIFVALFILLLPNFILAFLLFFKSQVLIGTSFYNPIILNSDYLFFLALLPSLSFFLIPSWLYNERDPFSFIDKFRFTINQANKSNYYFSQKDQEENSTDLERILTFIEKEKPYINTHFSLHDISIALNIPHTRVTNCFNKQLKVSFPSYRNSLRIKHAIELLRSGAHINMSIEGIAEISGFKSKSIFYKIFKDECGMTPIEWINKNI